MQSTSLKIIFVTDLKLRYTMKKNNKYKFGKTSIHSMIRMAKINEYGFNEILPEILMREDQNIKKIKKKKQNNTKKFKTNK